MKIQLAKINFTYICLGLIILLGFLIRIWQIGTSPTGVTIDEASFGYIANSIYQTGKDEHGIAFPLVFRAFGDQKLPLQAYLSVPSVAILGMNNLAVRLPSAVMGTISIALIYILARKFTFSQTTGVVLSLFWALAPVNIILSRFAYESNIALTFFLAGLIGAASLREKKTGGKGFFWPEILLWGGGWGITWYGYIAYRPVIIGLLLIWAGIWLWKCPQIRKSVVAVLGIITILILPSFIWQNQANGARLSQVGIFNDPGLEMEINEKRTFCTASGNPIGLCYGLYNKPMVLGSNILASYARIFNGEILFFSGDEMLYLGPEKTGYFSSVLAILILIMPFAYFFNKKSPFWSWHGLGLIVLTGLLISPLPAIFSGLQKVRLTPLYPFVFLAAGIGLDFYFAWGKKVFKEKKKLFLWRGFNLILLVFYLMTVFSFLINYFAVHIDKNDFALQSYIPELMHFVEENNYGQPIIFGTNFSDPLMFYSYFNQYDPAKYQENVVLGELEESGFAHAIALENLQTTHYKIDEFLEKNPEIRNGYYLGESLRDTKYGLDPEKDPDSPVVYIAKSSSQALDYVFVIDIEKYLNWLEAEI